MQSTNICKDMCDEIAHLAVFVYFFIVSTEFFAILCCLGVFYINIRPKKMMLVFFWCYITFMINMQADSTRSVLLSENYVSSKCI